MNEESERDTDLQPEYDLKSLRVRKLGLKRTGFGAFIQLAPDVADVFPNAEAVNEALRFLIRVTRDNWPAPESLQTGS